MERADMSTQMVPVMKACGAGTSIMGWARKRGQTVQSTRASTSMGRNMVRAVSSGWMAARMKGHSLPTR